VYFSQINQIHCRALITALVAIKIKFYLTFTYVRINFNDYLEIIAFQRLKTNIFTVKYITNLHVQISHFRLKYTPSLYLTVLDVRNNQFVVAKFHPIHINGVSFLPFEQGTWRSLARTMVNVCSLGLLFMSFNLTLR
jgi:hypothetical protein